MLARPPRMASFGFFSHTGMMLARPFSAQSAQVDCNVQKLPNWRGIFWMLKFVAAFAVLTVLPMSASTQVGAEEGRIHITFLKSGYGSGSGYLFYQGQKYGLGVSSTKIRRI